MARYPSYQPTNLPWLPEIPDGWALKRFATFFHNNIKMNSDFAFQKAVKFHYGELEPKNEIGDPKEYRETYVKYSILHPSDIVINGLNLNYDFVSQRVALARNEGIITSAYLVCRPKKGVNSEYFTYLLKAMDSMKLFHGMGTGIRLTLSFSELKSQYLPHPPLSEQERIVAYLDKQTAKVDALIKAKTEQMALLKELRERTIADAVTRGLPGEHTSFQSTNIPWLPEIPVSWEMRRSASLLKVKDAVSAPNAELLSVFLDRGVIKFSEGGEKRANATSKDLTKYQEVCSGEFVMNNQQAWRGSVGVSPYYGIVSPAYIVATISSSLSVQYANLLLRSKPVVGVYEVCSRGVGSIQRNLIWNLFKSKHLPVPPLSEQEQIVAYLDEQTTKIDKAVALLASGIEHLKAYRERLIADVVTGQLKVE